MIRDPFIGDQALADHLRERRAAVALAERANAAIAKASERELPEDERRQVLDLVEFRAACIEIGVACAIAAPVALIAVFLQLSA
jgi:hypothetical protein